MGDVWPDDVVEAMARAIREEIVRQHRDNDISAFPAGQTYYEEHVAPFLIARAALSAIAPYIAHREAAAYERAAQKVEELTRKHGNPNGNDYAQGTWDHGLFRCAAAIRALKPEAGA